MDTAFPSAEFIIKIMKRRMPVIPKISLPVVDVRDVAQAHVQAILPDKLAISNGKRYIIVEGSYWMKDLVAILKEEFKKFGYGFPLISVNSLVWT